MYQTKLLESKSMRGNTINALMTTLDEKSEETKAHTLRLSDICLKIAEQLEQHTEIKNRLALLAVLHDIGKVGIPDHILGKPEALTEDEWQIMKTHPEIGYRIASNVPELHAVANEILHHHEKWDGTGYPSGLKGEKIPINCRILSVVDSYDAMTNDRVYRKARTHEQAMDELRRFAGIQFDPIIVAAFAAIY
ncbi:MAG TPA: HD-GYP domain-containing protein, partial [Lachnospiraceae bacterium]|nr:HD-GYP domain-containing protein [Lachnospiraceae bacterium]